MERCSRSLGRTSDPVDVQRTLCALSTEGVAIALERYAANADELFVCGGGVHNSLIMQSLRARLPGLLVGSTQALGIHPDYVETSAFAWLAKQALEGLPGNIPSATGAKRRVILGGVYRA